MRMSHSLPRFLDLALEGRILMRNESAIAARLPELDSVSGRSA